MSEPPKEVVKIPIHRPHPRSAGFEIGGMLGGRAGNLILRSPGDFDIVSLQLRIIYLGECSRFWEYGGTKAR